MTNAPFEFLTAFESVRILRRCKTSCVRLGANFPNLHVTVAHIESFGCHIAIIQLQREKSDITSRGAHGKTKRTIEHETKVFGPSDALLSSLRQNRVTRLIVRRDAQASASQNSFPPAATKSAIVESTCGDASVEVDRFPAGLRQYLKSAARAVPLSAHLRCHHKKVFRLFCWLAAARRAIRLSRTLHVYTAFRKPLISSAAYNDIHIVLCTRATLHLSVNV